jgi:uncharacterized protein YceK
MKKLLIILALSLTGCSTVMDSLFMKYDPNEYAQIADIRTTAEYSKESCTDPQESQIKANQLARQTALFKNHTQYLPRNDKVIAAATELDDMAQGLVVQYQKGPVGPAFCKIKYDSIKKSAELIQKTVGAKPR